ncbi:MAG: CoA pyrophosphatase [Bacteroidia bacterium]|nr:CoA pyrophosphatase [Bacteroidia bacterium]NNF30874.1 CoA pyrophosphatase [Flavobacteriaceae bacterium]MBT8275420.1 CoA pyrophosphatase [Bacteroidia bacterium]NNJ82177.1 CoA pyrophosphatase [Flavobacteriaceae bacterium]NNK54487.1 CoA pyrophosphatase [Flavobacteriaceae bacterium]
MNFSAFQSAIVKIKKMPLPGEDSHMEMAPMERLLELKRLAHMAQSAKKAGVLMLFYPSELNQTHFVLILRKTYKGVHSAQVGFPGGKFEEVDTTFQDTALRETQEEVGVPSHTISVIRELTELFIPPSNYIVKPYLGLTAVNPTFIPQESEVEDIIEVPLTEFMDDGILIKKNLSTSYAKSIDVPAFKLQEHIVWGATAMMLNEVRQLFKKSL